MRPPFNAALNPHLELQDYGQPTLTATGWLFTRWRFERTGTGVTAAPGTTDGNANLEKWARSRKCADMVVASASYDPAVDNGLLRQRVPIQNIDRCGKQEVLFRVSAFGPDGGSFEMGLSGAITQRRYKDLVTQGSTPGGTPIYTTEKIREQVTEFSANHLTLEVFNHPIDADATYKIFNIQVDFLEPGEDEPPLYYHPPWFERMRCAPYLWPCPRGYTASTLAGGASIYVPISTPVEMNAAPSVVPGAAPVVWKQGSTDTDFNAAAPSHTGSSTHNRGGRIIIGGFSALPASGSGGQINSDRAFLLEAELG